MAPSAGKSKSKGAKSKGKDGSRNQKRNCIQREVVADNEPFEPFIPDTKVRSKGGNKGDNKRPCKTH